MADFHLLRPLWLFAYIPLLLILWVVYKQKPILHAWEKICDPHLLPYILHTSQHTSKTLALSLLGLSAGCMIFSLTGPTWSQLPVPTYQRLQPRVIVLDLSQEMLDHDLSPDRLQRAKFKLHDLLQKPDLGQVGLIVYTKEPFIVSPLTNDAKTMDELISILTPDVLPVTGQRLDRALLKAQELMAPAGARDGQILVLTAHPPEAQTIEVARDLAKQGIHISIIPFIADPSSERAFIPLAQAGHGRVFTLSDQNKDLSGWLSMARKHHRYIAQSKDNIPLWRDQGRLFLIPVLLLLLPLFQRGWLQRVFL